MCILSLSSPTVYLLTVPPTYLFRAASIDVPCLVARVVRSVGHKFRVVLPLMGRAY